jgi:hypothetical protein
VSQALEAAPVVSLPIKQTLVNGPGIKRTATFTIPKDNPPA